MTEQLTMTNRVLYALTEIAELIYNCYYTRVCLYNNKYILHHTNQYFEHRNFDHYYDIIRIELHKIVKINCDDYTIYEMDILYDIMKMIANYFP